MTDAIDFLTPEGLPENKRKRYAWDLMLLVMKKIGGHDFAEVILFQRQKKSLVEEQKYQEAADLRESYQDLTNRFVKACEEAIVELNEKYQIPNQKR